MPQAKLGSKRIQSCDRLTRATVAFSITTRTHTDLRNPGDMSDKPNPKEQSSKSDAAEARETRLAKALRDNIQRRRRQAQTQKPAGDESKNDHNSS